MNDLFIICVLLATSVVLLITLRRRHSARVAAERRSRFYVGIDPAQQSHVAVWTYLSVEPKPDSFYREVHREGQQRHDDFQEAMYRHLFLRDDIHAAGHHAPGYQNVIDVEEAPEPPKELG